MAQKGLPFGEINKVSDVAKNEQLIARNMFIDVKDSKAGVFHTGGFPLKMRSIPYQSVFRSPSLGEDTQEVLMQLLGMSKEEIACVFE